MNIQDGFKTIIRVDESIKQAQDRLGKIMPLRIERKCTENVENARMALAHLKNAHTLATMLLETMEGE